MRDSWISVVSPSVSPGSTLLVLRKTESTCLQRACESNDRCFLVRTRGFPTLGLENARLPKFSRHRFEGRKEAI
jgi:hypothetical protein